MIDNIFRNFVVSITPEVIQKERDGRMRTTVHTKIVLTNLKSGAMWTTITDKRVTAAGLETCVLTHFPESQEAQSIYSERNLGSVTLAKDCSVNNVAVSLHTALRKLTDSPASGYWWNLIHILPYGVMSKVWEATAKALEAVGESAPLCEYAEATKEAWVNTFDRIDYACSMYYSRKRVFGGSEHDPLTTEEAKEFEEKFENMSNKDFEAYKTAVKMAKLAIEYLDVDGDWASMLGYIANTENAMV